MRIEEKVLELNQFPEFNPVQKKALQAGVFDSSIVVSAPTASGKTIIAELMALHSIIQEGKKVIYTCPLKALASEHYADFKKKYSKELKVKTAISTGDFDSSSSYLAKFDLIYCTYEKLDSLIRHRANWLNKIGVLIVDEIHEIDSDRGPTLEMLITKLKMMNPQLKVLALSATIPNASDLAEWLNAELVQSDYRPVPLKEGVHFNSEIIYDEEKEGLPSKPSPLEEVLADVLAKEKQLLIFASTRRQAEQIARKLSLQVFEKLNQREKNSLRKQAEEALQALEAPTEQCRNLAALIAKGAAYHHAGLVNKQRTLIEDIFRQGKLKLIAATTTMGAGINLPAQTVVINSVYRYGRFGSEQIPVREFKQFCGRAGRPRFDSTGRAVLIARNELEVDELREKYIHGEIEEISSKLSIEPVLRMHLLSLIANHFVFNLDSLEKFFAKTFFAQQYGDISGLFAKLNELLDELHETGFIEFDDQGFQVTLLGNRVSELYLDPLSAYRIITALRENRRGSALSYLYLIADTFELYPYPNVTAAKKNLYWAELMEEKRNLFIDLDKRMYEDNEILGKFVLTKIFLDWINEVSEQEILENYRFQPGILRSKLQISDWLLYACLELEKCLGLKEHFQPLNNLRQRMKYGIKEELLALVQLKNIGRVRSRRLYRRGLKRIADLKKVSLLELSHVLGPKIAVSVKEQLGQKERLSEKEARQLKQLKKEEEKIREKEQASLTEF